MSILFPFYETYFYEIPDLLRRYKIYVEGRAWSVSEKYILACDATTLLIRPEYYDFFIRGMIPMEHYWPVRPNNKCRDIKFAVDWGNNHTSEVSMHLIPAIRPTHDIWKDGITEFNLVGVNRRRRLGKRGPGLRRRA